MTASEPVNASKPAGPLQRHLEGLRPAGRFSVWLGPVRGPATFVHEAEAPHYAASTMKLPLVMAAYRQADQGRLDLTSRVLLANSFSSASGQGTFAMLADEDNDPEPWRRVGSEVSVRWLAHRAIVASSNLATNALLDVVGKSAVVELLTSIGVQDLRLPRGIEDAAAREAGLDNVVTAADLALVLQSLGAGIALSAESTHEILSILLAQQVNDALPARLPPGTPVAHKSGWVEGISHDAGIVYPPGAAPFVFVMCTTSDLSEAEGLNAIAAAAELAWSSWGARP